MLKTNKIRINIDYYFFYNFKAERGGGELGPKPLEAKGQSAINSYSDTLQVFVLPFQSFAFIDVVILVCVQNVHNFFIEICFIYFKFHNSSCCCCSYKSCRG